MLLTQIIKKCKGSIEFFIFLGRPNLTQTMHLLGLITHSNRMTNYLLSWLLLCWLLSRYLLLCIHHWDPLTDIFRSLSGTGMGFAIKFVTDTIIPCKKNCKGMQNYYLGSYFKVKLAKNRCKTIPYVLVI